MVVSSGEIRATVRVNSKRMRRRTTEAGMFILKSYQCASQARAQDVLREKLAKIVETYDETSREIHSTLTQMDEAFELLMPKPDQAQRGQQRLALQDEDDLEWEDVAAEDGADGVYVLAFTYSLHPVTAACNPYQKPEA